MTDNQLLTNIIAESLTGHSHTIVEISDLTLELTIKPNKNHWHIYLDPETETIHLTKSPYREGNNNINYINIALELADPQLLDKLKQHFTAKELLSK